MSRLLFRKALQEGAELFERRGLYPNLNGISTPSLGRDPWITPSAPKPMYVPDRLANNNAVPEQRLLPPGYSPDEVADPWDGVFQGRRIDVSPDQSVPRQLALPEGRTYADVADPWDGVFQGRRIDVSPDQSVPRQLASPEGRTYADVADPWATPPSSSPMYVSDRLNNNATPSEQKLLMGEPVRSADVEVVESNLAPIYRTEFQPTENGFMWDNAINVSSRPVVEQNFPWGRTAIGLGLAGATGAGAYSASNYNNAATPSQQLLNNVVEEEEAKVESAPVQPSTRTLGRGRSDQMKERAQRAQKIREAQRMQQEAKMKATLEEKAAGNGRTAEYARRQLRQMEEAANTPSLASVTPKVTGGTPAGTSNYALPVPGVDNAKAATGYHTEFAPEYSEKMSPAAIAAAKAAAGTPVDGLEGFYKIQKGDTLGDLTGGDYKLARKIADYNNLKDWNMIYAGEDLRLKDEWLTPSSRLLSNTLAYLR